MIYRLTVLLISVVTLFPIIAISPPRATAASITPDRFASEPSGYWSGTLAQGPGTAASLGLRFEPDTLDFGQFGIGTESDKRSVRLINTGSESFDLGYDAAKLVPEPFRSAQDTCAGTSLAPGASCSFAVSFKPTAEGVFRAQIPFGIAEPRTLLAQLSLSGVGYQYNALPPSTFDNTTKQAITQLQREKTPELILSAVQVTSGSFACFLYDTNLPYCLPKESVNAAIVREFGRVGIAIDTENFLNSGFEFVQMQAIVNSPSDPDYKAIATPAPFPFEKLAGPVAGVTTDQLTALSALLKNRGTRLGMHQALRKSVERAQGAETARDTGWQAAQLRAVRDYATQLRVLYTDEAALRQALLGAMRADPKARQLPATELQQIQGAIRAQGLPQTLAQRLRDLGIPDEKQGQIAADFLSYQPGVGPTLNGSIAMATRALDRYRLPLCFAETRRCVTDEFIAYWQVTGRLAVNGFPLGEPIVETLEGKSYKVQYFERVRMEFHPDNPEPQYQVLLGQFGRQIHPADPPVPQIPGALYFGETGHNVTRTEFAAFWNGNGSLAQFGFPISEEIDETLDGTTYRVQYFERARLEWHPENPPGQQILLGQFGRQVCGDRCR